MPLLEVIDRIRPVHWLVWSAAILAVDYATGPFIQFPILFIVPVAMAAASHGIAAGAALALILPLVRLSFFLRWELHAPWFMEFLDVGTDVVILLTFAVLVDRVLRQQRELRVLQGLLPICSFCKKIRDETGNWRQLETYIAQRSEARFSHTFCEECGRRQYPDFTG